MFLFLFSCSSRSFVKTTCTAEVNEENVFFCNWPIIIKKNNWLFQLVGLMEKIIYYFDVTYPEIELGSILCP